MRNFIGTWVQVFQFVIAVHNNRLPEFDKVHYELTVAILEIFWCGCLTQMKENRQAYYSGTTDIFRQILIDTLDAGKRYAPMEETSSKLTNKNSKF
ncbi:MAG: hypothetical protein DLM72_07235 [Candidatus Nitrosopolaris wilkensis]|nr:MAG: hypothetical protein DLM72_07235 [Candidatus Nitrosopolaris wilkensis]